MVSIQLKSDEHLRAMARALRQVQDLDDGVERAAAYEAAKIPSEQIPAHDAAALEIERTRRGLHIDHSNAPATASATTEDWRL
jgi:hypothetical protein